MAKKVVNSDIYNISGLVDEVKKEYLPDETESTLAISTYGYIGAIESKRLQTQVQMTSELSNEAFPARARLERNVITHAIMYNIEGINAIPSLMMANFAIRQSDINNTMDRDGIFVIDRECPIYLDEFEFHLEYDIILRQTIISGNEKVYTAQYDLTRANPISDTINPYLNAPAVLYMDNDIYVVLTVILRQVHHQVEFKKMVTSNVIDNKTINFTFEDQLAYFEVKVTESDDIKYLTPLFEGSGVPDGTAYYCWYQYIDVNTIRVRFDRNSYMPGLNASIEVEIKTCKGADGNFQYSDTLIVNFDSSKYGYKNIGIICIPQSSAADGKNRKSKKELQALLPKEALARGSLTTIKDLTNYFGRLDSDNGRIVIQKKIDNQIERTYYAYLLLKDINGDIVPTNTIDLRIPMKELIKTQIAASQSPRYVLRPGSCFRLGQDGVGEITTTPILNKGLSFDVGDLTPNKTITVQCLVRIIDDNYASVNCTAYCKKEGFDDCASITIESPKNDLSIQMPKDTRQPEVVENNEMVSLGQAITIQIPYTSKDSNKDIVFEEVLADGFTYIKDSAQYFVGNDTVHGTTCVSNVNGQNVSFTIPKAANKSSGTKFTLSFNVRVNQLADLEIKEKMQITEDTSTSESMELTLRTLKLELKENPDKLILGNTLIYTATFKSSKINQSYVRFEISRGLEYIIGTGKVDTDIGNPMSLEPVITDLTDEAGFLYTNPYAVSINQYHLYSAFYMMCVNESNFLLFQYTNQKSTMQFIGGNFTWNRPFLGYNKNSYIMDVEITQSIAKDVGLVHMVEGSQDEIESVDVSVIALFMRKDAAGNQSPYRYKKLDFVTADLSTYSYYFNAILYAADEIDNDNNLKILNLGLLHQFEEDYGYMNPNTEVRLYTLCKLPNTDGSYTRYDLDTYVPGLDGWTVTNMYTVNTGVTFYHNYADIMGSRVEPYGTTKTITTKNGEETILSDVEGYLVKNVPVFGYDYSQDSILVNGAIDALNYRKAYIDETVMIQENSFGIDFKLFNTYGPSRTFFIIKDSNNNNILDDNSEFIDRVDIAMYFRMKLINSSDTYTADLIKKDIKDYVEDLNELGAIHIPNLVTSITNSYKETLAYFEFLGFNHYKADIQHIYKLADENIGIHIPPEHICIRNFKESDNSMKPNITIYVSES